MLACVRRFQKFRRSIGRPPPRGRRRNRQTGAKTPALPTGVPIWLLLLFGLFGFFFLVSTFCHGCFSSSIYYGRLLAESERGDLRRCSSALADERQKLVARLAVLAERPQHGAGNCT